jgi:nucleoside-diphosphate-sugar epimerase
MHVFVTGGSGQTGPTVVTDLLQAGHTVTALARSEVAAARLQAIGATPVHGSLEDLDRLRAAAGAADGVLHMAYGGDYADPEPMIRRDRDAIETFGRALAGTSKPLVITSGTLVMTAGRESSERDEPDVTGVAAARLVGERACLDFADQGVRAIVVRLAPTVHGPEDHGFMPMLIATARQRGVSAHVGDGSNRWPALHRLDAATLFRLALKAPAGSALHGVAENVTFKDIAETIGRGLGLPVVSLTPDEAAGHFVSPFMAHIYGMDAPASSTLTRELLGWVPTHPTLLADLEHGDYFRAPQPR